MENHRNVLIVDDSGTIRAGIKLVLQQAKLFDGYFDCADAQSALQLLNEKIFEVVLCDIIMPNMDGFEFLRRVKSQDVFKDLPVILLTGQDTVAQKIKGLELGASDYLTKPFDPGELIARVKVQQKVKRLQDELKIAKQKYRELAITDFLTGIINRRHFMDLYLKEFSRSKRFHANMSVIFFDLDNFKKINDTMGHLQGDRVLKNLTKLVTAQIRQYDVFGRYGGEEFILMLPQTDFDAAMKVAEKIRSTVEGTHFDKMDGPGKVTISLGVSSFPLQDVETGEQLIKLADEAQYEAKQQGKNRVMTLVESAK